MEELLSTDWLLEIAPAAAIAAVMLAAMYGVYRVSHEVWERSVQRDVAHAIIQLFLGLIGLVALVLVLPVDTEMRTNILTAGGLFLTAVVWFSSTTVIKDAAAGVTLRFIAPFRRGDYLSVGDYFGRVSDVGFFHTELQSEKRTLVTLTNSELLQAPFEVIPSSGTILSTSVSLGYDLSRPEVEQALLEAAEKSGLSDPFVHVEELGDFSVTYEVSGLLEDLDNLLTARSNFRKRVMDTLHGHGIEIVSPIFHNQRRLEAGAQFVPDVLAELDESNVSEVDKVVFDKALKAQKIEDLDELANEIEKQLGDDDGELTGDEKKRLERRLEAIDDRKEKYEQRLKQEP